MLPDDDLLDTRRLTAADLARDDSGAIARKTRVRLSRTSRMMFPQLLQKAEETNRDLEQRFTAGDTAGAMDAAERLRDVALRVADGFPQDWAEAERRIRLLYIICSSLDATCALRAVLGAVLSQDCLEWNVAITDTRPREPLH